MENNIIKIYKKRKYNEFLIEKREKINAIENKYQALIDVYNTELLKLLKEDKAEYTFNNYKINYSPFISNEVQVKIDEIEKEFQDKMDDRDRLITEVEAQLELCECRAQMLEVFKTYGILDTDSKIYDYRK